MKMKKMRMEMNLLRELMFESLARLSDANVKGEWLEREIKQAIAIRKLAEIAVVDGYAALAKSGRNW
jgi:hypothetical protein